VETVLWKELPESRKHHNGHTVWDSITIAGWSKMTLSKYFAVFLLIAVPAVMSWFWDIFSLLHHWSIIIFMFAGWIMIFLWTIGYLQDIGKPIHRVGTHCRSCGYDQRGSGAVCPECGAKEDNGKQTATTEK